MRRRKGTIEGRGEGGESSLSCDVSILHTVMYVLYCMYNAVWYCMEQYCKHMMEEKEEVEKKGMPVVSTRFAHGVVPATWLDFIE